jgi:exonuclease SbcC
MKPRRLCIEGLRSYRKRQEIEFEEQGLLAITGSTGAGKSSILEAILFALYGVYSGSSRSNKELISDRCDEMQVTLEFEVGGQAYTAHRSIGRKGQGSFAFLEGDKVISTDSAGMQAAVEKVLGLDADQFQKTVFLPQGAFQNFLTAKAKERAELLKRLLQFEALDQLEARVGLWLSQARQQVHQAQGRRSQLPIHPDQALEQAQLQRDQAQLEWERRNSQWDNWQNLRSAAQSALELKHQLKLRLQNLEGFEELLEFNPLEFEQLRKNLGEELEQERQRLSSCQEQLLLWEKAPPPQSADQLERLRQSLRAEQHLRIQRRQWEEQLPEIRAQVEQLLTPLEVQPALERRAHAEIECQQLTVHFQQQQQRQSWQAQLQAAQAQLPQVEEAWKKAQQLWQQGELYRICQGHQAGQPCPVCQQELPDGWQAPPPSQMGQAEFEAAQTAWMQQKSLLETAQLQLAQSGEDLNLPESDLDQAQARLRQAQQDYATILAEEKARQIRLDELQSKCDELGSRLEKQTLNPELPSQEQVEQWEDQLRNYENQRLGLQQELLQSQTRLSQLEANWLRQVEQPLQRQELLRNRCAQALGMSAETEELERHWREQKDSLSAQLEECHTSSLQLQARLDEELQVQGLASWEDAQAWLERTREQASRARFAWENTQLQANEALQLDQLLGPALERLEQLQLLSRLLSHSRIKDTRLTFPQWYLQRRQRELLELASQYLEELSGGQFHFETDSEDANSLRIHDRLSGVGRVVSTLSGGETFLASLSLAVSLAELVGRRGGSLQALFLDEGFGTLSSECLDRALTALEQLAARGRLIAIISHVPLIAERVEHCWLVRKTPAGSEIIKADEELKRDLVRQELANFDPGLHPLFG